MKAFLDTSVLVATFYADHEHHSSSIDLFLRFGKTDACCGALKAKAEVIYTWNTRDFLRLSPAIAGRVKNPDPR